MFIERIVITNGRKNLLVILLVVTACVKTIVLLFVRNSKTNWFVQKGCNDLKCTINKEELEEGGFDILNKLLLAMFGKEL